jgi:hypothetical protein
VEERRRILLHDVHEAMVEVDRAEDCSREVNGGFIVVLRRMFGEEGGERGREGREEGEKGRQKERKEERRKERENANVVRRNIEHMTKKKETNTN